MSSFEIFPYRQIFQLTMTMRYGQPYEDRITSVYGSFQKTRISCIHKIELVPCPESL